MTERYIPPVGLVSRAKETDDCSRSSPVPAPADEIERLIRVLDRSRGGTVAADELRAHVSRLRSQLERMEANNERLAQWDFTQADIQLLRDSANVFNYDITDAGDRLEDLADRIEANFVRRLSSDSGTGGENG